VKAGSLMVFLAFIDHRGCNRRGVALTRALHEIGKLEDLMPLENRMKEQVLEALQRRALENRGTFIGGRNCRADVAGEYF